MYILKDSAKMFNRYYLFMPFEKYGLPAMFLAEMTLTAKFTQLWRCQA
jgi:hypothetical protein